MENQELGQFNGHGRNDGTTGEFDGENYEHSQPLRNSLKSPFGLQSFRPNQLQSMNAALLGCDCFISMPPGGGKSLCYQLPAVIDKGITIVITQRIALNFDRCTKLTSFNIPVQRFYHDQTLDESLAVFAELEKRPLKVKILFVTPEKIGESPRFRQILQELYVDDYISRFVFDEAHCASEFFENFRPHCKELAEIRKNFPKVPIMALASAVSPRVFRDILDQLRIPSCKRFFSSSIITNLKYSVKPKSYKAAAYDIISLIESFPDSWSGIVYSFLSNCDDIAKKLNESQISAAAYHAEHSVEKRDRDQKDWKDNKLRVICATTAFGIDIDKQDVRFVIHHSIPDCIGDYYRQTARAGRDGDTAHCILLFDYADVKRLIRFTNFRGIEQTEKDVKIYPVNQMADYCRNKNTCRRVQLLDYFGERSISQECSSHETACDNCV